MIDQEWAHVRIINGAGKSVRQGGIEPPAEPWKGSMLPLHH